MAKIFITGSSQGLGLMTGQLLAEQGHDVVFHARNAQRAQEMQAGLPAGAKVVVGDVSTLAAMSDVAKQANDIGRFDAVIHNVGLGFGEKERVETADGLTPALGGQRARALCTDGAHAKAQAARLSQLRHAHDGA